MASEINHLQIVLILTFGFAFASILGYFSQQLKLSPIVGYLIGGYLIGPYSPGFVADKGISEQLAEIGVILMMFGVGLHFHWKDLINVRKIAIPGAIIQTIATTVVAGLILTQIGWSLTSGLLIGLAIGVASTVVLIRVLTENNLTNTKEGHIAIGWLIVEDVLTVVALVILPILATTQLSSNIDFTLISLSMLWVFIKFALFIVITFFIGGPIVGYCFKKVERTKSRELFTITILALTFIIATGSSVIFGTSIALGAFVAGMLIGQTEMRHQAVANALPIQDLFSVLFFLTMGMLFDPQTLYSHGYLFLITLAIIIIFKPLVAYIIVRAYKYPIKTALIVGLALGQIGEFSFILAEEASRLDVLPDQGYDLLVACALVSIALNPLLFKISLKLNLLREFPH